MQFNMATLIAALGMIASVSARCRASGPGMELGPTDKCPKDIPVRCAPRAQFGEIFGPCCSDSRCT
ncbi:hypothetical protein PspLS_07082 [Pyricularia sp. CBS 133598]|nr:hypothetical protein PspLS_07082 [Pyricularia sp. CBS 133598]